MHVHLERSIHADADLAWQLLGPEFASIDSWASFVKSSRALDVADAPVGMVIAVDAPVAGRETTTKATLREFIVAYSDADRSLTFEADGLPPIVRRGRNVQSIRATGPDTCTLVFEIDFDFRGPFKVLGPVMRKRMQKSLGGVMDDLKTYAEAAHAR
ncbi:MAG: SRPBCC family protein [Actinomycetota bacterium]